ncbi:MAG: ACT domain-containing protein [Angelakisella sp.]|nr:ACT domain-containing protein [Angelakisella sp.]
MNPPKMLLVSAEMLPSVFTRVLEAKRLLAVGKVKNLSEAAKVSGISRSALYKYKDHVFVYNEDIDQSVVTINVYLEDRPGVLSTLINRFSQEGANILTVNQNIPADGVAPVSISARLGKGSQVEGIINQIKTLEGVVDVQLVSTR